MANLETITQTENIGNQNILKKIIGFGERYIDYKMGLIGAEVMGTIVLGINYHETHELLDSSTAALKQSAYTFLFGGSVMRGCEYLATNIKNQTIALAAATIIPSAISIGLTYGIHNLKGTPKPIASTIPTVALIIPATTFWGYKKRKRNN